MALNFPHPPPFSPYFSEDRFRSPFGGASGRNYDELARAWYGSRDMHGFIDYGCDGTNQGDPKDSVPRDILDLLPADPFGMDMSSTFTASISGLLEDLEVDCGGYGRSDVGTGRGDLPLLAGWNLIWNNTIRFGFDSPVDSRTGYQWEEQLRVFPNDAGSSSVQREAAVSSNGCAQINPHQHLHEVSGSGSFHISPVVSNEMEEDLEISSYRGSEMVSEMEVDCSGYSSGAVGTDKHLQMVTEIYDDAGEESPHAAFIFALGHLGVYDLLSVGQVCKSLYRTVQNDPLLWRTINIDHQLSERITDDILLQLTNRAQGKLDCLSLIECTKITDDGLRCVLERNSCLTKLSVPGCTRLSVEGVISCLKAFNIGPVPRLKSLRIGGLYGMTEEHFKSLKVLLGIVDEIPYGNRKPHFYQRGKSYISFEDDRPIDIETCPRCQNFRLLYDCPAETCPGRVNNNCDAQICRACIICIPRCAECGRCISDSEYEETFCLELLCSDCGEQLSSEIVKEAGV